MDEALKIGAQKLRNLHFENKIEIKYLTRSYLVTPQAEISYLEGKEEVGKREKIIILHYLTEAKQIPLTGKLIDTSTTSPLSINPEHAEWIDFRDLPSGNMYYSVFEARVYQPFLAHFGKTPSLFIKAGEVLGGERIDFGDIAFRFLVLPKVPVNFILHKGDEEFPPACKVLFDSSISSYLPTEDIAIVCEDLVKKMGTVPDLKP